MERELARSSQTFFGGTWKGEIYYLLLQVESTLYPQAQLSKVVHNGFKSNLPTCNITCLRLTHFFRDSADTDTVHTLYAITRDNSS